MSLPEPQKTGNKLKRVFYPVLVITGYSLYIGGILLFISALPILFITLYPLGKFKRVVTSASREYINFSFYKILPALGTYTINGGEKLLSLREKKGCIVVGNHQSVLDGPFILSKTMGSLYPVVKSNHAKSFVFRLASTVVDIVTTSSTSHENLRYSLEKSERILSHEKRNLLIYPENTRSSTGRLLKFRLFAFKVAVESGAPVIPVVTRFNKPFLNKNLSSWAPPEKIAVSISVLDPVTPQEDESPKELADRVHSLMKRELKALGGEDQ